MSLGRHVQISSFPETFNDISRFCRFLAKTLQTRVCDLESSLGLGHVHIDRPSSIAIVPLQNRTSAGHSDPHEYYLTRNEKTKTKQKKTQHVVCGWVGVGVVVCVVCGWVVRVFGLCGSSVSDHGQHTSI